MSGSGANTSGFERLAIERQEGGAVLRILLDKSKGNVLDSQMMGELSRVLEGHEAETDLKLVILRGAGGHFSFGASVEEHRGDQVANMLANFHRLIRQLAAYPVPVAALIEGQCLGGGFELVLVCHLLFATPSARFACPEIKLGVFPPVLAAVGAERLGAFPVERILLTGESLRAEEALRLGWLTRMLESDDPEDELLAWYRKALGGLSAFSLRQGTAAVRRETGWLDRLNATLERAERRYLDQLVPSHDGNEGIEAFLERREPAWRNR